MKVNEIMSRQVVTLKPDSSVASAARLMRRVNLGSIPVCGEDGKIRGMVTDRDITVRCIASDSDPQVTPVKEIMTRRVITVEGEDDIRCAAQLMTENRVRRLPVTHDGRLTGFISLADMARSDRYGMEASKAFTEISSNVRRL